MLISMFLLIIVLQQAQEAVAQSGKSLIFGMSAAFSGPSQELGKNMRLGIEAHFQEVNDTGGIRGRKLLLTALDDGYVPAAAEKNMIRLIEKEKVLAVIGNVGTPTAQVTVPVANKKRVLLYGAFTGAGLLRNDPPDRYVVNFRASYAQETAVMINFLLKMGVYPNEIAFFTQNDGYGDAGYQGGIYALEKKGYMDAKQLAHGRYTRHITSSIKKGLIEIIDKAEVPPRAVIMVGSYKACAKFIIDAKKVFPHTLYLNVSFVGSRALMDELGPDGENVIVTQVVPHFTSGLDAVKDYRKAMKKYFPENSLGFVSLEGYMAARLMVKALKAAKKEINKREDVIDALESLRAVDIGLDEDIRITLSPSEHQALNKVWPTIIKKKEDGAFHFVSFEPDKER